MALACQAYFRGIRDFRSVRRFLRICTIPSNVVFCIAWDWTFLGMNLMYSTYSVLTISSTSTTIGVVLVLSRFQNFWSSVSRSQYLVIYFSSILTILGYIATDTSARQHSLFFSVAYSLSGLFQVNLLSVMIDISHMTVMSLCITVSIGR